VTVNESRPVRLRTIHRDPAEFGRSTFLLNNPTPSRPLALPEIAVADPAILVRDPRLLAGGHQVEMRDEHVLVGEREELGGYEGGEVEVA
jgi:hypothetical protein